jgi:hypothetical protein
MTSDRDPVGDAALVLLDSKRRPSPDLEFQCRRCHATGSSSDAARWVLLGPDRYFHVRARRIQPEATFGDAVPGFTADQRRRLCGEARQLGGAA